MAGDQNKSLTLAPTATGSTEPRDLRDRFADIISPLDFGAKGDGTTNDTAAFTALETNVSGRMIDLCGKSYVVNAIPSGNTYQNGSFKVSDKTYPAQGNNIFSYWSQGGISEWGSNNSDLNYFISDGWSTPASIERARQEVPRLKSVIAVGNQAAFGAIQNNAYLSDCIALGDGVMSRGPMTSNAQHNIGIGLFSLNHVTSGDRNIGLGSLSLVGLRSGRCNIAIGRDCCQGITTGSYNTAVGYNAMGEYGWANVYGEIDGQTKITGNNNVAVGAYAAHRLSGSSSDNVFIGYYSGVNTKTTTKTVVIGRSAMFAAEMDSSINGKEIITETVYGTYSQTGTTITINMPGHHAVQDCYVILNITSGDIQSASYLEYVTSVSGDNFTIASSVSNTASGECNVTIFEQAEATSQKSDANCMIGYYAGCYQKNIQTSVAVGCNALLGNVNASDPQIEYTTAVGYRTFESCTKGVRATGLGYAAGMNATDVGYCVVIGDYAALGCTSKINSSVIIGTNAANGIHTDVLRNVLIGHNAGNMGGSLTNCTCVGYYSMYDTDDTSSYEFSTAIGDRAKFTGSNQVQLGGYGSTVYAWGAVQDRSDLRDKTDIRDTELGLDFLLSLRPVDFRWDCRDAYIDIVEDGVDEEGSPVFKTVVHKKDGSRKRNRFHHGLIAQEVKSVLDEKGIDFGGYQDHKVNGGKDVLTLGYEEFIAPIIKSIQELNSRLEVLEGK